MCKAVLPCYRGSEDDVLARYYFSARAFHADAVVRVTSDCPLIDPNVIEQVISHYISNYPKYDYVSNTLKRTYPRGMDTEVFSYKALSEAFENANLPTEREHVTPYIYNNPKQYNKSNVPYSSDQSYHRWTVDTSQDLELIKNILESLYPFNKQFTLEDCLELMQIHSEWKKINEEIIQKNL